MSLKVTPNHLVTSIMTHLGWVLTRGKKVDHRHIMGCQCQARIFHHLSSKFTRKEKFVFHTPYEYYTGCIILIWSIMMDAGCRMMFSDTYIHIIGTEKSLLEKLAGGILLFSLF